MYHVKVLSWYTNIFQISVPLFSCQLLFLTGTKTPVRNVTKPKSWAFEMFLLFFNFSWMFSVWKFNFANFLSWILRCGDDWKPSRYFILRRVSLSSANCVLNSASDSLGETLRKRWLHIQNVIASTPLIFMLFEAIFIFVFVCSWWKRWKDLWTTRIPLRE